MGDLININLPQNSTLEFGEAHIMKTTNWYAIVLVLNFILFLLMWDAQLDAKDTAMHNWVMVAWSATIAVLGASMAPFYEGYDDQYQIAFGSSVFNVALIVASTLTIYMRSQNANIPYMHLQFCFAAVGIVIGFVLQGSWKRVPTMTIYLDMVMLVILLLYVYRYKTPESQSKKPLLGNAIMLVILFSAMATFIVLVKLFQVNYDKDSISQVGEFGFLFGPFSTIIGHVFAFLAVFFRTTAVVDPFDPNVVPERRTDRASLVRNNLKLDLKV